MARRDADDIDQIFFGATVTVRDSHGDTRTVSIVGVDEIDTNRGYISWVSPMARALIKAREGDLVTLKTPGGVEELEILEVRYKSLDTA
jgi:transcription elongation factor GreB